MIDVARLAEVSSKTVSRVMNGEPYVTDDVKRRVRAAADSLNYYPNMMAQSLVRRRSHLIGLVYENPSPSYVVELQMGVLKRLHGERYRMVVVPVSSVAQHARDIVELLRSAALDGVVLAPPASDHPELLADLAAAGIRCARIAPTRQPDAAPSNFLDDVGAAREIAGYLIGLGHREIAIIKGDPTHAASEARLLGYTQALHAAGVPLRLDRIESGMFTRSSGQAAAHRLLAASDRPTAILAQNDDMAVGALLAARERGLSVPEDISIVGFDDSEVAQISWPPITTIRQPLFDMAVEATDMVLAQLNGGVVTMRRDHAHTLVVRGSTGPPPAR